MCWTSAHTSYGNGREDGSGTHLKAPYFLSLSEFEMSTATTYVCMRCRNLVRKVDT